MAYDTTQLTLSTATDNTGQPSSDISYDIGPEMKMENVSGINGFRHLLMTTLKDLTVPGNLAKLTFTKNPGYTGSSVIYIEDGAPNDGLIDSAYKNISHTYVNIGSTVKLNVIKKSSYIGSSTNITDVGESSTGLHNSPTKLNPSR